MAKRQTISKRQAPRAKKAPSKKSREAPQADRPFAPGYGIVGAKEGAGLLAWSWVGRKMNSCHTFWVATVSAVSLQPHVMPVWGVWLEDSFFFSTGRKSRKAQNLLANPSCTVTNADGEQAVIVEGRASIAENVAVLDRVADLYKKKYKMDPRGMGEPIFAVRPTKVFGFVEKSFPKSATRWIFPDNQATGVRSPDSRANGS